MEILSFGEDNFASALKNDFTPPGVVKRKSQFKYLSKYLSVLEAKTIVIENDYVSKDYLYDYTEYYATCHKPYKKTCKRLHFFSNEFSDTELKKILLAKKAQQDIFFKNYLGFIVVKPIPTTVVGFTVLKTFGEGAGFGERNFWGIRKYKIHLFGKELEINSLAFQEQDSILAACATTAIWSMLNKASLDYYTVLKSPGEITHDAGDILNDGNRLFPNKGLEKGQICQSIFKAGLVCEVKDGDLDNTMTNPHSKAVSTYYLKKIINAYSQIGIPIILVVHVPTEKGYGYHAITVSGSYIQPPKDCEPVTKVRYVAENMIKLYAHDDQHGCFTRIEFKTHYSIETPWTEQHPQKLATYVDSVIVPLYPKIRIPYQDVEAIVAGIDSIFSIYFLNALPKIDLAWDIKLVYSEQWKIEIKDSIDLTDDEKLGLLSKQYPKYIWMARCYYGKLKFFDFNFDATDVSNGMIGLNGAIYIPENLRSNLYTHLKNNEKLFLDGLRHGSNREYYHHLLKEFEKVN